MPDGLASSPLILVVDDDPEVRRLLASGLSVRGFRVQLAANGREGMERLRAEVPRLVVLDYWMPVLDGAGFMSEMRELLPKRPPVILFTGVHDKPDLVRSLGVDVYVEKPIQMSRFVKLVEATLRGATAVELPVEPSGRERRVRARFVHRRAVEIRLPGTVLYQAAVTVDVSEGGLCLDLSGSAPGANLARDAHLGVAVELDGGRRVELDGRVKHVRDGRIGVQFLPLDAMRVAAVQQLLAEAGG